MPNTNVPATGEAMPAARLLPATRPTFLRDALRMKRERGDADADMFKEIATYAFASRLNATIEGALRTARAIIAQGAYPAARKDAYLALVADLEAIEAGCFNLRAAA